MNNLNISETTSHPLALYKNHLDFHGYQITEEKDSLFCTHPRQINLILNYFSHRGVLVSTIFSCNPNLNRINLLE